MTHNAIAAWIGLAGILCIGAGAAVIAPWNIGWTLIVTGVICVIYGGIGCGNTRTS